NGRVPPSRTRPWATEPSDEGAGRAGLADCCNLADADRSPRPSSVWVACELSVYSAVDCARRARLVGVAYAVTARVLEQSALLRVHSSRTGVSGRVGVVR